MCLYLTPLSSKRLIEVRIPSEIVWFEEQTSRCIVEGPSSSVSLLSSKYRCSPEHPLCLALFLGHSALLCLQMEVSVFLADVCCTPFNFGERCCQGRYYLYIWVLYILILWWEQYVVTGILEIDAVYSAPVQ